MTRTDASTTPGGDTDRSDELSEEEREGIAYWAEICAQRPPMTQERIEGAALILRGIDDRKTTN
ncbi:hypothetical protein [Umezawaea sp. Da 62-37]|uniref:hypothetical protein n=1 Tax=Umezawaea sp. Da 62-37 TaxID=3075927 RepID=UPI0028F71589|nr:hypothetical protein [Umezawaea sp. Da 62-37]WNV83971.1 hypothetical protein RM788_38280 [Umezawaea sp. Da 62-37]